MALPRSVHQLFEDLGTELDDLDLAYGTDGRIKQARAIRLLNAAGKKEWGALRADGVDAMLWKRQVALTVDSGDSDRYPLPPRTRQVILVQDSTRQMTPLSTYKTGGPGYVIEEGARAVRLRNQTVSGTVSAWTIQEPVLMSASPVVTGAVASTTLTLTATPSVGSTVLEDDFYNGAYVGIASGTGVGQVRQITDYVASTRVCTLSAAWTTLPTQAGSSQYSILTDLPDAAIRAQVLRAALMALRSDEVQKEFMQELRSDYQAAHAEAITLLQNANMPRVDTPLMISSLTTDDNGEFS